MAFNTARAAAARSATMDPVGPTAGTRPFSVAAVGPAAVAVVGLVVALITRDDRIAAITAGAGAGLVLSGSV